MKKLILSLCLFASCMQTSCSTDEQTSTCCGFFTTVRNYIFRQSHIIEEHQTSHLNNKPQEKKQITYLPTQEIPTLFDLAFKVLEPDIREAIITQTDCEFINCEFINGIAYNFPKQLSAFVNTITDGKDEWPLLHKAVHDNDLERTQYLIAIGADVNLKIKVNINNGYYPPHCYAPLHLSKSPQITQLLIDAKADVNVQDYQKETPLHSVAYKQPSHTDQQLAPQITQLLINAKADVNVQDHQGDTPLHLATIFKQRKIVPLLINAGANRNIQNNEGETPRELINDEEIRRIFDEADKADAAMIIQKYFRSNKATRKKTNFLKNDVVKFIPPSIREVRDAISDPSPEKIQWIIRMINHDASKMKEIVNSLKDDLDCPLLHNVASRKNPLSAYLLILAGVDINLQYPINKKIALHYAAESNQQENAQQLIDAGSHVNLQDSNGDSPLHYASCYNALQVAQLLIDANADVNLRSRYGATPLHDTARQDNLQVAQLLINTKKANLNLQNNDGQTLLHEAVYKKSPQMAQLLIDAKADVNIQDNQGHTALHYATVFKQREIIQSLLKANANRNIQNNDGETPRELINDEEIRRIFDEADKADAAAKIIQKNFS